MRFAHLQKWYDREGIGAAIWDPSRFANNPLPGVSWHGLDSSIPTSGVTVRPLFYMPRVGFAYDISGQGNTVLRGGFGMYRYHDSQQGGVTGAIQLAHGARNTNRCCGFTLAEVDLFDPNTVVSNITVLDPNDRTQPVTYSYSFTVQQRLPKQMQFEVSYVGNQSEKLINQGKQNINVIPIGTMLGLSDLNPDPFRPISQFGTVSLVQHNTWSNYNGLQALLNRQTGRIGFSLSYTFSKTLGIRGAGSEQGGAAAENHSLNLRANNYGVLPFDRTHVFSASYSIMLPDFAKNWLGGNRVLRGILDGWQISGITQAMSGAPLQAFNSNFSLSGPNLPDGRPFNNITILGTPDTAVQPVLTCDPRKGLGDNQYINPSCFALPTPGNNGAFIMPYLKGPAFQNHDLSIFKNFVFSETKKLQFRASAFNFLNHPLPSLVDENLRLEFGSDGRVSNPNFGRVVDNKFGRRIVQLAVKFYF